MTRSCMVWQISMHTLRRNGRRRSTAVAQSRFWPASTSAASSCSETNASEASRISKVRLSE